MKRETAQIIIQLYDNCPEEERKEKFKNPNSFREIDETFLIFDIANIELIRYYANGYEISNKIDENIILNDPGFYQPFDMYIVWSKSVIPLTYEDRLMLRGNWIKHNYEKGEYLIIGIVETGIIINGNNIPYEELEKDYEFINGQSISKTIYEKVEI